MPFVNIKAAKGISTEKKAELIKGATDLLFNVLGKPRESTYVVIEEIDTDNWGVGGQSLTVRRAAKTEKS